MCERMQNMHKLVIFEARDSLHETVGLCDERQGPCVFSSSLYAQGIVTRI